jgi:hypothetical protein
MIVIDGNSSETTKKNLANCNTSWTKYRLVCISPTVGAGIDFSVKDHFHVSFGYGSWNSCCARGFNQMRGRVRFTIDKECHLYIKRREGMEDAVALPVTIPEIASRGDIDPSIPPQHPNHEYDGAKQKRHELSR